MVCLKKDGEEADDDGVRVSFARCTTLKTSHLRDILKTFLFMKEDYITELTNTIEKRITIIMKTNICNVFREI